MKKIWLILSLVVFLGATTGCKDDDGTVVTPPVTYPVEIPFEEYSLDGTACQWENIEYNLPTPPSGSEILIINSNEELAKYVIGCTDTSYPEVDFSKKTVLLARGRTYGDFRKFYSKRLSQLSENKYQLDIEIGIYDILFSGYWATAIVVDNLGEGSSIELTSNINEGW